MQQGSGCSEYTDRTLQLVNGGFQLYVGVRNATCFNWLQNVSFKEPYAGMAQINNNNNKNNCNNTKNNDNNLITIIITIITIINIIIKMIIKKQEQLPSPSEAQCAER